MKRIIILFSILLVAGGLRAQEINPAFPGGEEALYKFIDSNLRYPEEALDYHIEGRVFISFVVEESGYADDAKILLGLPGGCGQAALDLVKRMPLWKPGGVHYNDGRTVIHRMQFTLPVNFKLEPQYPRRTWSYSQDTADIHFPGGTDALYRYLAVNIDYPREYWNTKVTASVWFDSTGRVDTVSVDAYQELSGAICNAIMAMPRWQLGKLSRNKRVNIPIDLRLLASMHDTLIRPSYFTPTDRIWQDIIANEAYFRQLLSVNDSLVAGYAVPAERLQALIPHDVEHFYTLCGVDYYVRSGYGMVIMEEMMQLAVEDTLDMMEYFVHWFNWCDGYVSELIYDYAIDVEKRHPEKFRRLMMQISSDSWESFLEWRDMLLEWEKENK